jgi:hypothetical protein
MIIFPSQSALPSSNECPVQCCADLAVAHALLAQLHNTFSQQSLVGIQLFA